MPPSRVRKQPTRLATRSKSPYCDPNDASNNSPSTAQGIEPTDATMAVDVEDAIVDESQHTTATINGEDLSTNMDCFGQHGRQLITAIQNLEALEIDSTLESLPKYVVVGDQSHGKSSIIEAVCDITLPRSEGTCTRCPFQITTTASKDHSWSCNILLSRRYTFDPHSRSATNTGWRDSGNSVHEVFDTLHDKTLLDRKLRLAQIAILNPGMSVKDILQDDNPDERLSLSFSLNVIRLEIKAPDLPELSFFDLPGAINVHSDMNDQHVVPFVESLIKFYVEDEKALILLAVSANQDVETSTAFKFILQSEALGRCMGVVTKPDLASSKQQILKILRGEKFKMGYGWYVTKQPSQAELDDGITHAEARTREQQFFATQEPWCGSDPETASRFGTRNLQDALSRKLTEHIISELPGIQARVQAKLSQINAQLEQFPEQARAPCQTVSKEIDQVKTFIAKHIHGYGADKAFRNDYRGALQKLRKALINGRPEIKLTTPGYEQPSFSVESDNDENNMVTDDTPTKRKRPFGTPASTLSNKQPRTPRKSRPGVKLEASQAEIPKTVYELDGLKDIYDRGSMSGLPDHIDPIVTEEIAIKPLRSWQGQIDITLETIKGLVLKTLTETISTTLSSRRQTKLYIEVLSITKAQLDELAANVSERARYMMTCELLKPITFDLTISKQIRTIAETLINERREIRINEHFDQIDAATNKCTPVAERKKRLADPNFLGPDSYHREIQWIATPLAYYDVASTRVVDATALLLEHGLLHMFETNLKERLETNLHVTDSEYCAQLLAEDPERERLRRSLIKEREKLQEAMKELEGLPDLK